MSLKIISKERQAQGAFNGGEIIENKPIGFPQDGGEIRPFSNLFYWAHAKAVTDSTIGLHPHQGFEICSFVLRGPLRHFDTKLKDWRPLSTGDVQILRAGNGISHAEFMGEGAEMFQIWFDPNLDKTLGQPATYDDYRAADFPVKNFGQTEIKTLVGDGSPFKMETPGVEIFQIDLKENFSLPAQPDKIYTAYLIEGQAKLNGEALRESDFAMASSLETLDFSMVAAAKIFVLAVPAQLNYRTYFSRRF